MDNQCTPAHQPQQQKEMITVNNTCREPSKQIDLRDSSPISEGVTLTTVSQSNTTAVETESQMNKIKESEPKQYGRLHTFPGNYDKDERISVPVHILANPPAPKTSEDKSRSISTNSKSHQINKAKKTEHEQIGNASKNMCEGSNEKDDKTSNPDHTSTTPHALNTKK